MKDNLPFEEPSACCGNCRHFNGDFCTKDWNNMDEAYKVSWRDAKEPDDWCEDYEEEEI